MKSIHLILFICSYFVSMLGYSQDTTKTLSDVVVTSLEIARIKTLELNGQYIRRDLILTNQPQDLGSILQKFSGTTLKSYGGLGGLKTISVRGLGSQHTTYVIDGFSISNTQTGQVNLGQVQTDNVENISLSVGGKNGFLLPVSSYLSGSLVSINTFENTASIESFKLRACTRVGSFGEVDNYLSMKFSKSKVVGSVFGKYRQAHGNYDYSLQNGTITYKGTRTNNDLKDWYSGAMIGYHFKNEARFRVIYKTNGVDQGLPGAVILYNETANQRLRTEAQAVNIDFSHRFREFYYRFFGVYNHDRIHYTDPSYLNNTGGLSNIYTNNLYQTGVSFQRTFLQRLNLFGGLESRYSDLSFSAENSAMPKRLHSYGLVGASYHKEKWTIELQVSAQQVLEENNAGERAVNRFRVNPFIAIEKEVFGSWNWKLKAWYRNSFRMPSFNELYYNSIGNVNLKPEEAQQFSFGFSTQPALRKTKLVFVSNGFANQIWNQILAIPTKNLFVWSMQNIGRVNTFGYETRLDLNRPILKDWVVEAIINYTYQHSIDVSNPNSPTYLNQVAYIPKHTGNFDYTLKRKNTGIHFSVTSSSIRYSLLENIPANAVDGFTILDASIFTKIKLEKKQDLRIQFSVKNLTNSSYAYIRYFVMPGRNYLITLNYAIH